MGLFESACQWTTWLNYVNLARDIIHFSNMFVQFHRRNAPFLTFHDVKMSNSRHERALFAYLRKVWSS